MAESDLSTQDRAATMPLLRSLGNGKDHVPYVKVWGSAGGGGVASSVAVADGDDVTQGAKADTAASSDTGTFSIVAFLKRLLSVTLLKGQAVMASSLPAVIASDQSAIQVKGALTFVTVELTRANNATPYTAGDIVSDAASTVVPALVWTNALPAIGATGYIVGIIATTNRKSLTPRLRIHIFNDNTATVSGDNLPHRELYADVAKRCRYLDLPAMTTGTDTTNSDMSRAFDLTVRHPVTAGATRHLYPVIEALDAVTWTALDKISITVIIDPNG